MRIINILYFFWELIEIAIIALIIVVPIRYFIFQPFFVRGYSMEPNFHQGDYLIVDEISYRFNEPKRGEVVVFKYPKNPSQRYIKRIIGLPGEAIEIKEGKIFIYKGSKSYILDESNYLPGLLETPDNEKVFLGKDEYFVLGDNRNHSYDSEDWGILPKKLIIGRVILRIWPFTVLAKIGAPQY